MTLPSFKIDRVKMSLLFSLFFIFAVPFIPALYDHVLSVLIAMLVAIAVMAAMKKSWVDVALALIIAAAFGLGRMKFNVVDTETFIYRTAAILAFIGLHVTLLIGPWSRFNKRVQSLYKHRRHLGVSSFLLACLHAMTVFHAYFAYSFESAGMLTFVFFGFTTLYIMALLALTSWDWVQKHVTYRVWIVVHLAALLFYAWVIRFSWSTTFDLVSWQKALFIAFIAAWILLAPWAIARLLHKRVNGWKQLHRLIYIGYVSLIVHVWYAYVIALEGWIPVVFWICVVSVAGSHGIGWLMALKQWIAFRRRSADTITVAGKTYQRVGAVEEFMEGKGSKRVVNKQPVAVFLHQGKFFAMSNSCPHQGGPICDGKIVNGYVECPWHKYQFGVNDGIGPPEFKDCIPYFPVTVKDKQVYVCTQDTGKCKEK